MGHLERALFVIGDPNTGKSNQLRSIFRDVRFHREGKVPKGAGAAKLPDAIRISNERWLYLRLTSPHEMNENMKEFLQKTAGRFNRWQSYGERWNFAGAIQPNAAKKMPDAVATIRAFIAHFSPERTRAAFLNPDRNGKGLPASWLLRETKKLWADGVEVMSIDARSRDANGLLLADFFDFT